MLLVAPVLFAGDPARDIEGFKFETLQSVANVKLERVSIYNDITDFALTITSTDGRADFTWQCDMIPFFYPEELNDLKETEYFDLTINLDDKASVINHYTAQTTGILISRKYLTNHHQTLIASITAAKSMEIGINNLAGQQKYVFPLDNVETTVLSLLKECQVLY